MTVSTHKSTAQGSGSFKDDGGTILNGGKINLNFQKNFLFFLENTSFFASAKTDSAPSS